MPGDLAVGEVFLRGGLAGVDCYDQGVRFDVVGLVDPPTGVLGWGTCWKVMKTLAREAVKEMVSNGNGKE